MRADVFIEKLAPRSSRFREREWPWHLTALKRSRRERILGGRAPFAVPAINRGSIRGVSLYVGLRDHGGFIDPTNRY